jgi:hypothetical protein
MAFEIGNAFITLRGISRILRCVEGVTGLRTTSGSDDRLLFEYAGESCVVSEPFGDNSRYWIGPAFPERSSLDVRPLQQAFARHTRVLDRLFDATTRRKKT